MFSPIVTRHWIPQGLGPTAEDQVYVAIDPSLAANRSVALLRVADGPAVLTVTPERARQLALSGATWLDAVQLTDRIAEAGITLNDPDHLLYLPVDEQVGCRSEAARDGTRRLTVADEAAFARFQAVAPDDDLAEAFVKLDHWLVFGTFMDGDLVAAASMYLWAGTVLADLGVITLPNFRGSGLGAATVRAMSALALENDYEPQYRCQLDNAPSIALARSAGFAHFGRWEVIVDE